MDARKLKEKATEAFTKGKFSKAAELYDEYCRADPKDLQARLRMGDAWAKGGQRGKAIAAYQSAAEGFAHEGFLPRAIAASKLILELDPMHQGVQQMLAALYAKRSDSKPALRAPPYDAARTAAPDAMVHRVDAIDLPAEDEEPIPLERGSAVAPAAVPPPAPIEDDPSTDLSDGIELSLDAAPELTEARPAFEEPLDGPLEGPLDSELTLASEIEPLPLDQERPVELPPALQEPERIEELLGEPLPELLGVPPGLRLKRSSDGVSSAPARTLEVVVELTVKKDADRTAVASHESPVAPLSAATPRIWIPNSFVAAALTPPSSGIDSLGPRPPPAASPPVESAPTPEQARKPQSELEASLAVFAQIDEPELVADAPRVLTYEAGRVPTFTELELEGDSLLHAVEMAAQAGIHQRTGEATPDQSHVEERVMTAEESSADSIVPGALPKIPLFSDLAPEAFIELFERCPLRRFGLNTRIIEQGSLGEAFYVICAGAVRVLREDGGARQDLATLNEGAFFGEMALLSGAPRTASVESASDDTQLLEISATVLAQLSHRYPGVATALKKFCRQRLLTNLITTAAMFAPLSKKERKTVVERFRARDLARNDVAIREGDLSSGLFVVLSGEMQVRKGSHAIATLKEGDVFGEMSLIKKGPAIATVLATKRTSLLRLPREEFDSLMNAHPQILEHVSRLTEQREKMNATAIRAAGSGEMLV